MPNFPYQNTNEYIPRLPLEMQIAIEVVRKHHILLVRSIEDKKLLPHYYHKTRYIADQSNHHIRYLIKSEIISIFNSIPDGTEKNTKICLGDAEYTVTAKNIKNYLETGYTEKLTRHIMNNIMDFPNIAIEETAFDSNPYEINASNGIFDIKARELLPHRPDKLNRNIVNANYTKDIIIHENNKKILSRPSLFTKILHDALYDKNLDDIENGKIVRSFIEILASFLIGNNEHKLFFILLGVPNTGKSTLLEFLIKMFHEYCAPFNNSALMLSSRSSNDIRPDLTIFPGKRFLLGSESNKRDKLDNALIKQLSGNDTVSFRKPHKGEMITFTITGKIMLATNFCPNFSNLDDDALLNRIVIIDFNNAPKEMDRQLKEKLLLPENREQIFSYLANIASDIVARGSIFIHKRFWANRQRILINQDSSVSIFWKKHIRPYEDYKIPAKFMSRHPVQLLYSVMYLDFCLKHDDIKPLKYEAFAKEFKTLSDNFPVPSWKKGTSNNYYIGFDIHGGQAEKYYNLLNNSIFDKKMTFGETLFE